jgi:hypothetical protein
MIWSVVAMEFLRAQTLREVGDTDAVELPLPA